MEDDGTSEPDDGSNNDTDANDLTVSFDDSTGILTIAGDDLAAVLFSRLTSLSMDGDEGDDQFFDIINAIETVSNSGFE